MAEATEARVKEIIINELGVEPEKTYNLAEMTDRFAATEVGKDTERRRHGIVRAMNGNVCRCGTYPQIVAAIQRASRYSLGKPQQQVRQQQEKRP